MHSSSWCNESNDVVLTAAQWQCTAARTGGGRCYGSDVIYIKRSAERRADWRKVCLPVLWYCQWSCRRRCGISLVTATMTYFDNNLTVNTFQPMSLACSDRYVEDRRNAVRLVTENLRAIV